jgi:hypothetical protein
MAPLMTQRERVAAAEKLVHEAAKEWRSYRPLSPGDVAKRLEDTVAALRAEEAATCKTCGGEGVGFLLTGVDGKAAFGKCPVGCDNGRVRA